MQNRRMLMTTAAITAAVSTGFVAQASAQVQVNLGSDIAASEASMSSMKATSFRGDAMGRVKTLDTKEATLNKFLADKGMSGSAMDTLQLIGENETKFGRTHMRFEQRIGGKRVYGAMVKAAFDEDGSLLSVTERLANSGDNTYIGIRLIGPKKAVSLAVSKNHPGMSAKLARVSRKGNFAYFDKGADFYKNPSVEEVIIASPSGGLSSGYLVETWSDKDNMLYHTLVDGFGRVVQTELRTSQDSYNVFPIQPGVTSQRVVNGPGSGNTQSPNGWLFSGTQNSVRITGNNVRAYLDRDANNSPDGGGRSITNGNFLTSANLGSQPTTTQNSEVAVQNLFYLNNVIHDRLYGHGFRENTGNFQENNFGRGGAGSDSVNAEAQDGSGVNNANFATPGDGSNPRMQMYLWNQTNPQRDGDIDSDIVWHEYGHGLTGRMIGGMSGAISGAIGEGMSDVLAILVNNDDTVGEYSLNNANGIRSAPYTNYPRTIGDFTAQSVHFDGEIYAAALWSLKGIFQREGLSTNLLLDYVVDGMNFTAPGPDYMDMRDGILDSTPNSRDCLVWEAFANFGMGAGSSMPVSGGQITINESFNVPSFCSAAPPPPPPPQQDNFVLTSTTGFGARVSRFSWVAVADMVIQNNGAPAQGVTLGYTFSQGGSGSCVTNSAGICRAISSRLSRRRVRSVTFSITSADRPVSVGAGVPTSIRINRR